ncbi:hypothetical protein V2J09_006178 [Rumex salicifolius]
MAVPLSLCGFESSQKVQLLQSTTPSSFLWYIGCSTKASCWA